MISIEEKLVRFHLEYHHGNLNANNKELWMLIKMKKDLVACLSLDQVELSIGNKPRPCPTPVKMYPLAIEKHVRCGHGLELSMLTNKVFVCDCCGIVKPGHMDSQIPEDGKNGAKVLFGRSHLQEVTILC